MLPARVLVPAVQHVKGTDSVTAGRQKRRSRITLPRVTATPGVDCRRARPAAGFRAPQPKRLTLSCRTGFAEGKRMKLSLPGSGCMTRDPGWTERAKLPFVSNIKAPDASACRVYARRQRANPEQHCYKQSELCWKRKKKNHF